MTQSMTPAMTPAMPARARALETRFDEIGETMRELPLYNAALSVEAWGFRPHDETALIGILVTPWFMNLVLLPRAREPIEPNRYGEAHRIALPGGEKLFLYGGDEAVGAFRAASLHSPMDVFVEQAQARAEAKLRLAEALTPPAPAPAVPETATPAGKRLSRRALLAGRASG